MEGLARQLLATLDGAEPTVRDRSFDALCRPADLAALRDADRALEDYAAACPDLFRRVRALLFRAALNRFWLAPRLDGPEAAAASALGQQCRNGAFDALADQVRASVRASEGNDWLFTCTRAADLPLRVVDELRAPGAAGLRERTPVRMDLSHSGWSDIFFLAMDDPEAARVVNVSIDLAVHGSGRAPEPPIEARVRVLDRPVLRLVSDDLHAEAELTGVDEVFDFGDEHLGLLRAGVVASGWVPPGLEAGGGPLAPLLARLVGEGRGLELATRVTGIPRGSRLAVSTLLLAGIIAVCMRATGQTRALTGPLEEAERRLVAARAVLGEWLGGSAGGWQDSGGLWPGAKRIEGVLARPGDVEHGRSRGRLLPRHTLLPTPPALGEALQGSLLLAHGGMSGDVGPILERVTEDYLLRHEPGFSARRHARRLYDEIVTAWQTGDVRALARATDANFHGPLQTILPQANNLFTQTVIDRLRARLGDAFHGFWMLGGMSGGGMGFWVDPQRRDAARETLHAVLTDTARELDDAMPFSIAPVLYDFAVNESGSLAERAGAAPPLAPPPRIERSVEEASLDDWLARPGFDADLHERTRADLRAGRIGVSENRLPPSTRIEDARAGDVVALEDAARGGADAGRAALAAGRAAVVTLAGGVGSRWTRGARVVKALHPVCAVAGRHRRFLDFHLAHSRAVARQAGVRLPHLVTTSYATHASIERYRAGLPEDRFVDVRLSEGRRFGLRLRTGDGADFREARPSACLHPLGHWYEVPNLLTSGALLALLHERPDLDTLFVHNVDTLGAHLDPSLLGWFRAAPLDLAFELVPRWFGDVGGGLARVDGALRLVEGLALPSPADGEKLSTYSSMSTWLRLDGWLASLSLGRDDLSDAGRVEEAVRAAADRVPSYVTRKEVRVRDARGREATRRVHQFEKLWGDVSADPRLRCGYLRVPRVRGQQLKDPVDLDVWLRDGSAPAVVAACDWGEPRGPADA
ncbi:MAG: UTP--glucose-1-phosphate uridylyltransferase [Myxococcota bacterium]